MYQRWYTDLQHYSVRAAYAVSFVALKLCHRFFFGAGGLARRVAYGLDSSVMMFTFLAGVQVTTALLADGRDEQPIWLVCATLVFVCGSALEMTAVRESAVPTAYEPPDAVWNGIIAGRAALDGRLPAAGTLLSLPAAAGRLG